MKRIIIAITIIISVLSCSKNNDDDENPFLFAGSDYTGSDLNLRINDFGKDLTLTICGSPK